VNNRIFHLVFYWHFVHGVLIWSGIQKVFKNLPTNIKIHHLFCWKNLYTHTNYLKWNVCKSSSFHNHHKLSFLLILTVHRSNLTSIRKMALVTLFIGHTILLEKCQWSTAVETLHVMEHLFVSLAVFKLSMQ
jgi:hypothetical protein